MKQWCRQFLSLLLALLLLTLSLPVIAEEPVTLSIFVPNQGRNWKEDSLNGIEIQKRLNIKLELDIGEPDSNRFNLMVASGDLPDLCLVNGMKFLEYLPTGYFMPVGELVDKYGENLKKCIPQAAWDMTAYAGENYVIPYVNNGSKYLTHIRKDWLDALGLDMPHTLDDFTRVMTAFTYDDPDRDGKQDTYGLGNGSGSDWNITLMMIFGAFGGMPGHYYAYDDAVLPYVLSDDYRAALNYTHGLWEAGVMDPEIFILEEAQARQKMVQGVSGAFNGWWSISTQTLILKMQMDEVDPNVEWAAINPTLQGPDGRSGMGDQGSIGAAWLINAECKHPETAVQFLDFLATDEGFYLASYGIEGLDYEMRDGFIYRTESGQQAYNDYWLDTLGQYVRRQDLLNIQQNSPTENADELLPRPFRNYVNSGDIPLYTSITYGMPITKEASEYGASVDSYVEQMAIEFITGQIELNDVNWKLYTDTWMQRGGAKILAAEVAQLNASKGTTYTVGI